MELTRNCYCDRLFISRSLIYLGSKERTACPSASRSWHQDTMIESCWQRAGRSERSSQKREDGSQGCSRYDFIHHYRRNSKREVRDAVSKRPVGQRETWLERRRKDFTRHGRASTTASNLKEHVHPSNDTYSTYKESQMQTCASNLFRRKTSATRRRSKHSPSQPV